MRFFLLVASLLLFASCDKPNDPNKPAYADLSGPEFVSGPHGRISDPDLSQILKPAGTKTTIKEIYGNQELPLKIGKPFQFSDSNLSQRNHSD